MLYTLKNHEGIFLFERCHTGENSEPLAVFQKFGAMEEPVTVPAGDATEYTGDGDPRDRYEQLAIKSVKLFHTDTRRTHRALTILRHNDPATDENDFIYQTSRGELQIKSREDGTIYTVTPKSCTCPDSRIKGNICKHRIAAYIFGKVFGEPRIVPMQYEFNYCLECGCHHWIELSAGQEICHGEKFDPRNQPNVQKVKARNFSSSRYPARLEISINNLGFEA